MLSQPALTLPTGSFAPANMPGTPRSSFRKFRAATFPAWSARSGSGADLAVGDAVFGVLDAGREGTYCEKIAIKAAIIAKKPDGLSHVNAAALALTGLTAMNSLEDTLKLKRGETILIQGGAGGVAGFAIQFAKHLGARVITTTSAANADYVRSLGADQVIDYNSQDFTKLVSDCDAVFDTVGGDVAEKSFAVLKPGGRAAFIASGWRRRSPRGPMSPRCGRRCRVRARRWSGSASSIASGAVRPPEIKLYRLEQAAEAHRLSESAISAASSCFRYDRVWTQKGSQCPLSRRLCCKTLVETAFKP